jgi:FkbM family methyltransferase
MLGRPEMMRWLRKLKRWLLARLPKDCQLWLNWRKIKRTTVLEPEIFEMRRWARSGAVAVDAGANIGLIASELAQWFERVEAFEPNYDLTEYARKHGPRNIRFHAVGLSSDAEEVTLHIPVDENGVVLAGWATLEDYGKELTGKTITLATQVRPLDEFQLSDVAVMKIDVEGHEKQVLEGAAATIQRCRPVVMCETRQEHREWLRQFAAARNYDVWRLADGRLTRDQEDAEAASHACNLFLIPMEQEGTCS